MQTYLFYDIETTGLNKSFDQVLQFAAIRTDLELNEMERYEIKIKLNNDTIPSPRALLTHQIGVHENTNDYNEYEAIQHIHRLLNAPGTTSLGYNTLGFDDEFLRFSFFRNLLSPYTHQFANDCNRMDLYPITVMYYLFKKDCLNWPIINDATSLKLEWLNQVNQLAQGAAHNAMVDVEVTLQLAKRFCIHQDMWRFVKNYFNKKIDKERCQQLPCDFKTELGMHHDGLLIDGILGHKQQYQCPVLFLGEHTFYKNQTLWLRLDNPLLMQTTEESIAETTWVIKKKWGEPSFILPPKERYLINLSSETKKISEENKKWLIAHPKIFQKIISFHRQYVYPNYPHTDVQSSLYLNGFLSREDEKLCQQFHLIAKDEKAKLAMNMQNKTLQHLALRILGRHYPETLHETGANHFSEYLNQLIAGEMIDFKGEKRLTPRDALDEIESLKNTEITASQKKLLEELRVYLTSQFRQVEFA